MLWTIKANGKRQRNIHLLFLRHRQQPEIVAGYCGGFWRSRAVQNDTVSWNHRIGLPNRRFYIPRIYGRTARHCPPVLGKLSVQERRVLFLHRHILHVQGLCGVRCGQNHVRQRRASGLWLQPAHRRELPEGIRGIFSKEDEDTGTAELYTSRIIDDLKKGKRKKPFPYCRLSDLLHKGLFNAFFSRSHLNFSLENGCMGCGVCERVCPVNNITLKNGVPRWGIGCEACHACVHWCPGMSFRSGSPKGGCNTIIQL